MSGQPKNGKLYSITKKHRQRKVFTLAKSAVLLVILAVIAVFSFVYINLSMNEIAAIEAELELVRHQIEVAQSRRQEIIDTSSYTQSEEFIENFARNFLGLVRRDEIIFIIRDGNGQ